MRSVVVELVSISPYSQSRFHDTPKLNKETSDAYERRTWRERAHYDETGHIFIPPMQFKKSLEEVAKFLGIKIPGRGKNTYTKHFEAGVMVMEGLTLPETRETVKGEWLLVPADGKRGGTKRVKKCFPVIPEWSGKVTYNILDDTITPEVFEHHLREAGQFIGIGRWRPRQSGLYGRYRPVKFKWENKVKEM